jgi:Rrf2 family protein
MQLTRAADYAVRVMIHLAGLPPGTRASRGELARAAECPEQFLSKVLQSLTRAGLVISHRGNTGGFELPEARRGATILNVVQAIEGPVRLNLCLTSDHACSRQRVVSGPWRLGRSAEGHAGRFAERLHRQPGSEVGCPPGAQRKDRDRGCPIGANLTIGAETCASRHLGRVQRGTLGQHAIVPTQAG